MNKPTTGFVETVQYALMLREKNLSCLFKPQSFVSRLSQLYLNCPYSHQSRLTKLPHLIMVLFWSKLSNRCASQIEYEAL